MSVSVIGLVESILVLFASVLVSANSSLGESGGVQDVVGFICTYFSFGLGGSSGCCGSGGCGGGGGSGCGGLGGL